jgi:threonyl-tRNA synthetase
MAQAVKQLFPDVLVTIGPFNLYKDSITTLNYREASFTDEELVLIENRMKELIEKDLPYSRKELTKDEAIMLFGDMGEKYKLELLEDIPDSDIISSYTQGDFIDLCRGPHIPSTGKIKAIKLLKSSGAYWRGDEKNKMLKRIYGLSFPQTKSLASILPSLKKQQKGSSKAGKDLDLFLSTMK